MRLSKRLWSGACLIVLLVGGLLLWLLTREPTFHGQSLSDWFEFAKTNPSAWQEYGPAFRSFDHEGVRFLIRRLTRHSPAWKFSLYQLAQGIAAKFSVKSPIANPNSTADIEAARRLLGYYGTEAAEPLLQELNGAPDDIRISVIQALGELGPDVAGLAGPLLLANLTNSSPTVVYESITALGIVQYRPEAVAPRLLPFLTNLNTRIRVEATYTLSSYPKLPDAAVQPLIEALSDKDPVVRANAARALGNSGSRAEAAMPTLQKLLSDGVLPASRAVQAIAAIRGGVPDDMHTDCNRAIQKTLDGIDDYFKLMVLPSAGDSAGGSARLLAVCAKLLKSPKNWQVWEAVDALSEMKPRSPRVVELLQQAATEHPNGLVRAKARAALWHEPH